MQFFFKRKNQNASHRHSDLVLCNSTSTLGIPPLNNAIFGDTYKEECSFNGSPLALHRRPRGSGSGAQAPTLHCYCCKKNASHGCWAIHTCGGSGNTSVYRASLLPMLLLGITLLPTLCCCFLLSVLKGSIEVRMLPFLQAPSQFIFHQQGGSP